MILRKMEKNTRTQLQEKGRRYMKTVAKPARQFGHAMQI